MQITKRLPDDLSAAAQARALIRTSLADWGLSTMTDDVEIVASELVANALRHGATPIAFTLEATDDHVLVAVQDAAAARVPLPRLAGPAAENGRGMQMITAVSRRWGCTTGATSKVVWAELPIS